jgi:hypothetical protein
MYENYGLLGCDTRLVLSVDEIVSEELLTPSSHLELEENTVKLGLHKHVSCRQGDNPEDCNLNTFSKATLRVNVIRVALL